MEALWQAGCRVQAYDPVAMPQTRAIYGDRGDLTLCNSAEETLAGADALAIVTEWREFRSPSFELIKSALRQPVITPLPSLSCDFLSRVPVSNTTRLAEATLLRSQFNDMNAATQKIGGVINANAGGRDHGSEYPRRLRDYRVDPLGRI